MVDSEAAVTWPEPTEGRPQVGYERGREVYERFLHRGVDPALLEQDAGNQFSARVFPIAAAADKELIIAYDHQVSESRPYTLALAGLPAIPSLSMPPGRT